MINQIEIKNYKSIETIKLDLGRVNIFIGENGAGKSNVLEAIALAGATSAQKLDNEFLASRGVRITKPELMRSSFDVEQADKPIDISIKHDSGITEEYCLKNDNEPYSKWVAEIRPGTLQLSEKKLGDWLSQVVAASKVAKSDDEKKELLDVFMSIASGLVSPATPTSKKPSINKKGQIRFPANRTGMKFAEMLLENNSARAIAAKELGNFVIFSPENSSLRIFDKEGQIEPLGINGEGLLKLISVYSLNDEFGVLAKVKESLKVLDWFIDFESTTSPNESRLLIKDRYLSKNILDFDHKSANEGFLFLLFYFLLFYSKLTPSFFAIDNIDASLNPKLCRKLITELVAASKANDKQSILTTHNPAILDGINLDDDEQRLFVISRSISGHTRIKRVHKPAAPTDMPQPKLSELFLRGMLGGLPKGF